MGLIAGPPDCCHPPHTHTSQELHPTDSTQLGGTALAPQLQLLLCLPMYDINAPPIAFSAPWQPRSAVH